MSNSGTQELLGSQVRIALLGLDSVAGCKVMRPLDSSYAVPDIDLSPKFN
jgi:hypothetical protein